MTIDGDSHAKKKDFSFYSSQGTLSFVSRVFRQGNSIGYVLFRFDAIFRVFRLLFGYYGPWFILYQIAATAVTTILDGEEWASLRFFFLLCQLIRLKSKLGLD